jgi:hypothetical protein
VHLEVQELSASGPVMQARTAVFGQSGEQTQDCTTLFSAEQHDLDSVAAVLG